MASRRGTFPWILIVILAVVVLLQLHVFRTQQRVHNEVDRFLHDFEEQGVQSLAPVGKSQHFDEGDWRVWAFRVEPKTLNQISVERDVYSMWMMRRFVFEPLLEYDLETLSLKPLLAESYSISDDGLQIDFYLRDDIHFSDGHPVTAEDILFTYETIVNPRIDAADLAQLYVNVEKVQALSDRHVRFILKKPYFKSLEICSFWDTGIYPKHIYEFEDASRFNQRRSDPVGSGPYVFERWDSGSQVILRRSDHYWGIRPHIEKLVYKFITNAQATVQALLSGEVDMIIPSPEQYAELAQRPDIQDQFYCLEYLSPDAPFFYIGWNMETPLFQDRRVRLAMTHMVDRQRIVDSLLKGHSVPVTGPYFVNGPAYDHSVKAWPYDLSGARQLLDEAGWIDRNGDGIRDKNGMDLRFEFMYTADSELYRRIASFLKDAGAQVGAEVVPSPLEWSVVITRITDRDFEAMIMGWGGDISEDFYQIFHSSQADNRGSNYVMFRNERADELLEQIRVTLDDRRRYELCHEFHRLLHQEQPYTFLFARPLFRIVDRRFANVNIYKLGPDYMEWYVPRELQKYR